MRVPLFLSLALAVSPAASAWDWGPDCRVEGPREASLDAAGAKTLRVLARAGALRIVGEPGATAVKVAGKACAHDQETLDAIRLRATKSGGELRVEAEMPESFSGIGSFHARLDLELRVPASLPLEVEDSSGLVEIADVASLRIEDGSGEIGVRNVAGEVEIRDGSGEIEVVGAGRVLIVDDGSGEIDLRDVKGDVVIREDGSGTITIRDVGGSVRIDDDGSGSVDVVGVAGDLLVGHKGSGAIRHDRVKGRVEVPRRR
ncbi:MAG: hypothetical protein AB7O37_06420 [Vicinamibacteria bacterium]